MTSNKILKKIKFWNNNTTKQKRRKKEKEDELWL